MTTAASMLPALRTCPPSGVNARPARATLLKRKQPELAEADLVPRSKKARRSTSAADALRPSFTPQMATYIPQLKFRFRKHETNKLPELGEEVNKAIAGAVCDLRSPIARSIDIKGEVLRAHWEQNGIFLHDCADLFFPWKEHSVAFRADGIYGAKRSAVLLNLHRLRKHRNIDNYIVASSIACAENIRRSLPSHWAQDLCERGGVIPVYVLGYDRDKMYLYSAHISTKLLDGLKSPTIAIRNYSADVHFWEAGFRSGKELRLLLCNSINALKTEWHLSTSLELSYQSTT